MQVISNGIFTLILALMSMLGPFATDTYLPSFYAIAGDFSVTEAQVQQTLSVYLLSSAVMSLFHGTLSDSYGRKSVLQFGLLIFGIASVGAMLAPNFETLLVFRAIQGMSAGVGMIIGQAMVRDRFEGAVAQKMMANIMMVFGLAPAIAPIIGGYIISHINWRGTFAFLLVFTVIVMLLVWKVLPETLPAQKRMPLKVRSILHSYGKAISSPLFMLGVFAAAMCFGFIAMYISSAAALIIKILGMTETDFHWLFLPMISGIILGSAINSKLASSMTPQRMILIGYSIMITASIYNVLYNLYFPPMVTWVILPLFIHGVGMAMAMPTIVLLTLGIFPEMKGLASSLVSFTQMTIFALIAGVIAPLLFDDTLHMALGGMTTVMISVVAWSLVLFLHKKQASVLSQAAR